MHFSIAIPLALFMTMSVAQADECLLSDDYDDASGLWTELEQNDWVMTLTRQSGRMEVESPNGYLGGNEAGVAALAEAWSPNMNQDWAISIDMHIDPPEFLGVPGQLNLFVLLAFSGDLETLDLQDGWGFQCGSVSFGSSTTDFERTFRYENGKDEEDQSSLTDLPTDDTYSIWFDASEGMIYVNTTLYQTEGAFESNIGGMASIGPPLLVIGGEGYGTFIAFNNSELWWDNICLQGDGLVGDSVGACCIDDACFQTLDIICEGEFNGAGYYCDSDWDGTTDCIDACPFDPLKVEPGICGCGVPDTDSDGDGTLDCNDACPDDPNKVVPGTCGCGVPEIDINGDGLVDQQDLLALVDAWGNDCSQCASDLDASGTVDVRDLLVVLTIWSHCP